MKRPSPIAGHTVVSETNLFNFETRVDDCNDNRAKEVRYRFSLELDEEPRITIEHDEYIIRLRNRRPDFANSFTTGPNESGYALNSIDLSMHSRDCSAQNPNVEIWSSKDDGTPWASQWGLRRGRYGTSSRYTAPQGARLTPNTKYWVVVGTQYTTGFTATPAPQPAAVNTALNGWTFGDGALRPTQKGRRQPLAHPRQHRTRSRW